MIAQTDTTTGTPPPDRTAGANRVHGFDLVSEIAERLRGTGVYREVLDALGAAALKSWPQVPAAFVLPLSEAPGDSLSPTWKAIQRVEMTVAVNSVVAAPNDRSGARAKDALAAVLGRSRACLAGFRPEGATEVMRFAGGRLIGIKDGRVEWRDEYRLVWWFQSAESTPTGDLPDRLRNR